MSSFDDSDLYGDLYDTVDEAKPAAAEASAPPGSTTDTEMKQAGSDGAGQTALSPPVGAGLPAIPQQGSPMHFDADFAKRQRAERDRDADTADAGYVENQ